MKLLRIIDFAHSLLKKSVSINDIVIDATVGNGYDTVFLAHLVGTEGKVFGFDIQAEAIYSTKNYLIKNELDQNVTLYNKGHETIMESIPSEYYHKITGAIFNLGYLPGGDKQIVTKAETTISAIKQLIEIMKPEGIIILVIYHGHPGGAIERDEVMNFVETIDQKIAHVIKYQFINQINNPPFVIAIEKR